jgi:hypothetical protein
MLEELRDQLARPFDPEAIYWKPQATNGDRALAIAYADARAYQDRLNEVAGADWSDEYEVLDGGAVVLCRLTVAGVTRADIGEAEPGDRNTATSALAQAFKRAAVKFGVGRYLYDLPKTWVDYDAQRKRFTPDGERKLRAVLAGGEIETQAPKPSGGNGRKGNGKATSTDFWTLYNEQGKGVVDRAKAQEWAASGDWAQAIEQLRAALN